MSSRREQIIAAIVARIKAVTNATVMVRGREVDDLRLLPDELPAIVIEKRSDAPTPKNETSRRTLELGIAIYTADSESDTDGDAINQLVIPALLARGSDMAGASITEGATEWETVPAELPVLRTAIALSITYRTQFNSIS